MEMANKKLKINLDKLGQDERISVQGMENIEGQAAQGPEEHVDGGGGASVKTNCFGIFPEEVQSNQDKCYSLYAIKNNVEIVRFYLFIYVQ